MTDFCIFFGKLRVATYTKLTMPSHKGHKGNAKSSTSLAFSEKSATFFRVLPRAIYPLFPLQALMSSMRRSSIFLLFASLVGGMFLASGGYAMAQRVDHLPPEKAEVVRQLHKEIVGRTGNGCLNCAWGEKDKPSPEDALSDLDPVLVGRHIVFDKKWINYVGQGKPLTPQQFEMWVKRLDRVYDSYVELTGSKPNRSRGIVEKVFIDIVPRSKMSGPSIVAHSHHDSPVICFNKDHQTFRTMFRQVAKGCYDYFMMHELAHKFENNTNWCADIEALVDMLVSYALESIRGAHYHDYDNRQRVEGAQHRRQLYGRSVAKHNIGSLKKNRGTSGTRYDASALDIMNLGLVDVVGWEAYKQTFRSYDGERRFLGGNDGAAREFLDRLEHFGGKPGIHRSIPVMAAVVDKYFSFQPNILAQRLEAEQQGVASTGIASVPAQPQERVATPTTSPTPSTPTGSAFERTIPRPGGRSWTNSNLQ